MVGENTSVRNAQVLHTLDAQSGVESVAHSAGTYGVVFGNDPVAHGGFGLFGVRVVGVEVFGESALVDFAFEGFGAGHLFHHLDTCGQDGDVGGVLEEGRVDGGVFVGVGTLDVHGAAAEGVLEAHGGGNAHGLAGFEVGPDGRLVGVAFFVHAVADEDELEVCGFVVFEVRGGAFVLLSLEGSEVWQACFDGFQDFGLLLFGSEKLLYG